MSTYEVSLDFGSSKIAVAVGLPTEKGIRIVSYHDAEIEGIICGEIIKDRQVVDTVKSLIEKASQDIEQPIDEVSISISGKAVHYWKSCAEKLRNDAELYIEEPELSAMTKEQFNKNLEGDNIVYDVIPQSYNIDNYLGRSHQGVIGMKGEKIEASYIIISGKKLNLQRRNDILDACQLKMKKAILSPIASARAVLNDQEMENGAVLVDMGKDTTEIVIVKDNTVRAACIIPFAGESITRDIKNVTNITAHWAERIKLAHGCSCADFTPENKKLILKAEDGTVEGEVELKLLSEIIEARLSEILEAVRWFIEQSGYANSLSAGVVITGGTAYMEYMLQMAKAFLGDKVRLAAARNSITADSCTGAFDTYASTAVGLVLEACKPMLSHALLYGTDNTMDVKSPARNLFGPELEVAPKQRKPRTSKVQVQKTAHVEENDEFESSGEAETSAPVLEESSPGFKKRIRTFASQLFGRESKKAVSTETAISEPSTAEDTKNGEPEPVTESPKSAKSSKKSKSNSKSEVTEKGPNLFDTLFSEQNDKA